MNYLTKIDPLKSAFFVSVFEFFALLVLPFLSGFNFFFTGLIDGVFAAVFAIFLFNLFSDKFSFGLWIDKKHFSLRKLDLLVPSLANGLFLVFLFGVQGYIEFSFRSDLLNDALLGFSAVFAAMVGCVYLYNLVVKYSRIRLKVFLSNGVFRVGKIDLVRTSFFVALFELFILPLMGLFFIIFRNFPFYAKFPFTGLFAGFLGSLIASYLYNFFARFFKGIGFKLE